MIKDKILYNLNGKNMRSWIKSFSIILFIAIFSCFASLNYSSAEIIQSTNAIKGKSCSIYSKQKNDNCDNARKSTKKAAKPICPHCKSKSVIPVVYGYPDNKLLKEAKKGNVRLEGCIVSEKPYQWYCKRCKKEF